MSTPGAAEIVAQATLPGVPGLSTPGATETVVQERRPGVPGWSTPVAPVEAAQVPSEVSFGQVPLDMPVEVPLIQWPVETLCCW